tara:strand:+ start:19999 stop:21393 length:1395 start_codon:yes stop_codon:yes gene_type:complete
MSKFNKNLIFDWFSDYISKFKTSILCIPYIIISAIEINDFSLLICFLLITFLFVFDFCLQQINFKILNFFIAIFITFFLYSLIVYNDTYLALHDLRFRSFSLIFFSITALVYAFTIFKLNDLSFTNTVIIIFSFLQFFNIEGKKTTNQIFKDYNLLTDLVQLETSSKVKSPIVLIICDGLTSTNEIFNITKNNKDLNFEKFLKSNDYIIKDDFKSKSSWTQFSLTSLLNLNLHKSDTLNKLEELKTNHVFRSDFWHLIKNNLLVDSLLQKDVKSYSYGVLPFFKGVKTKNSFYLWNKIKFNYEMQLLKNFKTLDIILRKSVLNFFDSRFFGGRTYTMDKHRQYTLDMLRTVDFNKNNFYYFHYYAPHSPFSFFNDFPYVESSDPDQNFINHYKYRRFMMDKLIHVLSMEKFNNVRIIISGDHGFRSDLTVQKNTMGAFKGFEGKSIEQMRTVQDIGSLILHSMN